MVEIGNQNNIPILVTVQNRKAFGPSSNKLIFIISTVAYINQYFNEY